MTNRTPWNRIGFSLLGVALMGGAALAARAADVGPADLVDALNGVFGKHKGDRAAHTKGFCLTGQFTPAPDAAALSKAPHFAKTVPVTGRFSLGGGNPQAADDAKDNVRGMALRFNLGDAGVTDLVMISAPVFFVQTPALFVEFLHAVGSGDQDTIKAFFAAHPESARQNAWLTSHPVPASYAGVNYWGVHAFTFTNAKGDTALVKYKAIPDAGELGLTDDEAKAKGGDFYQAEMTDRLAKGPVTFELVAIRGKDGDQTSDPTQRWDDEDGARDHPARQDQHRGDGAGRDLQCVLVPAGERGRRRGRTGRRSGVPGPVGRLCRLVRPPPGALMRKL